MKKLLMALAGLIISLINAHSQSNTLDAMLTNVNQSSVTSGIIYERAAPFANLYNYNGTFDTATLSYFEQAFSELYNASNQVQFMPYTNLRQLYTGANQTNVIDIGVINTQFSILNYNEANPYAGGLTLSNNQFYQIAGAAPFINLHKLVIAPLRVNAVGSSFTFNFRSDLLFSNGTQTITNLTANLGDGVVRSIISGGVIVTPSVTTTYSATGDKVLSFTATFSDGSFITTNGKFFVKLISPYTNFGADPLIEDGSVTSSIAYQGYTETAPVNGQLQYRIFYHNNNGNTQPILQKPIIISDGFDPGDSRKIQSSDYVNYQEGIDHSIEDMMRYKDCNGNSQDLIKILRARGYDVVVVNYPKYVASSGQEIDGGADYIERNAMNMVSLIQMLKGRLNTSGSSEQLVAVGPSMGGQITRYALAYMEKKYAETGDSQWLHRTRLWISVDSPHLGANIPYGAQSLVYQLKDKSPKAGDFYNNWLGSVAAKQQLIELQTADYSSSSLNGRTISQGFSSDAGSPFYQQYYNNLFNNGLSGSKGYPMNLRKIALVNGSLSGKKTATYQGVSLGDFGNPGDERLNVRGFIKTFWWDNFVTALEGNNMPSYGTSGNVSRYFQFLKTGLSNYQAITNINSRGSMDIIPGGYFPPWDLLNSAIIGTNVYAIWNSGWPSFEIGKVNFESRTNAKISSFIPSFSALGIKNPEQDWSLPLNRNLVCSNETPFDSFYGEDNNTQHTSFNCESVTWLLKELDGIPQAPIYPVGNFTVIAAQQDCGTVVFTVTNPTNLPSYNWTLTGDFNVNGATSITTTTNQLIASGTNGQAYVQSGSACYPNLFGAVDYSSYGRQITGLYPEYIPNDHVSVSVNTTPYDTYYRWYINNTLVKEGSDASMYCTCSNEPPEARVCGENTIWVEVETNCNITTSSNVEYFQKICGYYRLGKGKSETKLATQSVTKDKVSISKLAIYPNPVNNQLNISLPDSINTLKATIQLIDVYGKVVKKITSVSKSNTITMSSLPSGMYLVEIYDGAKRITTQKIIKQ